MNNTLIITFITSRAPRAPIIPVSAKLQTARFVLHNVQATHLEYQEKVYGLNYSLITRNCLNA